MLKFHTDDAPLPWRGDGASLAGKFFARSSDVILQGNQWWLRKKSAVLSGQCKACLILIQPTAGSFENEALENEDRSTKDPKLENEAPKSQKRSTLSRKRSTQNSKMKHPNLENEAPYLENEDPKISKTKHSKLENEDP